VLRSQGTRRQSIIDWDGIKMLLEREEVEFLRLWLDAGYRGENKGKDWVQKALGWSLETSSSVRESPP